MYLTVFSPQLTPIVTGVAQILAASTQRHPDAVAATGDTASMDLGDKRHHDQGRDPDRKTPATGTDANSAPPTIMQLKIAALRVEAAQSDAEDPVPDAAPAQASADTRYQAIPPVQ